MGAISYLRPLQCRFCRATVLEHYQAGAEFRYTCRHCKGRESSTGVINGPDQRLLQRRRIGTGYLGLAS